MKMLSSSYVDKTLEMVGLPILVKPLFYNCTYGLRYEINEPWKNKKDYNSFIEAFDKCNKIFSKLQKNFHILRINLFYNINLSEDEITEKVEDDLGIICSLTGLQLPIEEREIFLTTKNDDGIEITVYQVECYWDLSQVSYDVHALLMQIILADFPNHGGGHSQFSCSVYFFNVVDHIIFNLYDDRILDIVSYNKENLASLYYEFNDWLLEFDRTKMNRLFENSDWIIEKELNVVEKYR